MDLSAKRHSRGLLADRSGAALVEFAVLLPLFVALAFGIMQVGQVLWTQTALQHAVEMAARCGSINTVTCGTAAQIRTYAATQAYGLSVSPDVFVAANTACGSEVTADFAYSFPVAALISPSIRLTARSCYPR